MTSPWDDTLLDLISRWEEQKRKGRDISLEELCVGRPELLAPLRRKVSLLEKAESFVQFAKGMVNTGLTSTTFSEGAPGSNQSGSMDCRGPEELRKGFCATGFRIGDYEVLGEIGRGGMGIVFRAFDHRRGQLVAMKTLQRLGPKELDRFKREFRALADLTHPNLAALYELVLDKLNVFYTMELIDGVGLLDFVRPRNQPLNWNCVRESCRQLAEGVAELHAAGTLHRDIKPGNVLVTNQGRVVLLDCGLAAELDPSGAHQSTERHVLGTLAYMSPEQAGGDPVTPASDWYSVGVVLYQMMTGRLPFGEQPPGTFGRGWRSDGPSPGAVILDAPADLNLLCTALLRRDPSSRPLGPEVLDRLGGTKAKMVSTAAKRFAYCGETHFVGRKRQLELLNQVFEEARNGRCVTVLVHGESGVGKSSLVHFFLDDVHRTDGAVVLAGRCHEREAVPYKALDDVIGSLCRYLRRLPAIEAEALLPRDVLSLVRVFPAFRNVEGVVSNLRRAVKVADPLELRRRGFDALRELLARLGDRHPLVLFIDDLQWGDEDSALLLSGFSDPPDPPALLLIGAFRSQDAAASSCVRVLRQQSTSTSDRWEVAVGPLSFIESEELALMLLGKQDRAARERAMDIIHEAGGSPLFVAELVRHIKEGASPGGSRCIAGRISLDEVLWGRILQLPTLARKLLEVVAVCGQPLGEVEACRVAEIDDRSASVLTLLRCSMLLRQTGPQEEAKIETYHDRVRETVVAHLAPESRVQLHRRLAQVLEASGRTNPEILAIHYFEAGESIRAAEYYSLAAFQAADTLAFDRAAALYRLALELRPTDDTDTSRMWMMLANALANDGRGFEAARAYLEAACRVDGVEAVEFRRSAAMQYLVSGHIDEGVEALRVVLATVGLELPKTPRRTFWMLLWGRMLLRLRGTAFREQRADLIDPRELHRIDILYCVARGLGNVDPICAAAFQARNLLASIKAGEPFRYARALAWEAAHQSTSGTRGRRYTERLLRRAVTLARDMGCHELVGLASTIQGIADYLLGQWASAVRFSDNAVAIFRDHCKSSTWEIDTSRIFALWSLCCLGDIAEMKRRLAILFKEARDRDDLYAITSLGTYIRTLTKLADDDPDEARRELVQAMNRWSGRGFHVQHHNKVLALAHIELYCGRGEAAWEEIAHQWHLYARSMLDRVQQVRVDILQLRARCALAAAHASHGPRPYLRIAKKIARRLEREGASWADAYAVFTQALIAQARCDTPLTVELLVKAARKFEENGMLLVHHAAQYRIGELVGGDEGHVLVAAAEAWMTSHGVLNPARMARMYVLERAS